MPPVTPKISAVTAAVRSSWPAKWYEILRVDAMSARFATAWKVAAWSGTSKA